MHKNKKNIVIIFFMTILLFTIPPCWADDAIMLTVRTELLAKKVYNPHAETPTRNPFSWPVDAPENIIYLQNAAAARAERIKTAFGNIRLGAILWNKKTPRAIINDTVVSEKDVTMGTFVEKINKDSVILRQKDMLFELNFSNKPIYFESID